MDTQILPWNQQALFLYHSLILYYQVSYGGDYFVHRSYEATVMWLTSFKYSRHTVRGLHTPFIGAGFHDARHETKIEHFKTLMLYSKQEIQAKHK